MMSISPSLGVLYVLHLSDVHDCGLLIITSSSLVGLSRKEVEKVKNRLMLQIQMYS